MKVTITSTSEMAGDARVWFGETTESKIPVICRVLEVIPQLDREDARHSEFAAALDSHELSDFLMLSRNQYDELVDRSTWLSCLERAGVDNWQGFDEAIAIRDADG